MILRTVEKRVDGPFSFWQKCRIQHLRKGDIFQMFEPDGSGRVGDTEYVATGNPILTEQVWGIPGEPYNEN
jgi:hypothetical protein